MGGTINSTLLQLSAIGANCYVYSITACIVLLQNVAMSAEPTNVALIPAMNIMISTTFVFVLMTVKKCVKAFKTLVIKSFNMKTPSFFCINPLEV